MRHPRAAVLSVSLSSAAYVLSFSLVVQGKAAREAPAGFDNRTNGMLTQADLDSAKAVFEERDEIAMVSVRLQRSVLRGMPSEPGHRRDQPDL